MALFMNDTKVKSVYWNNVKAKKVYFNNVLVLSGEFAFTYTGAYAVEGDMGGNFVIRFKTSGTLTITDAGNAASLDVFLVGGGGGAYGDVGGNDYGGGGGGYTKTTKKIELKSNTAYQVIVGAGGAGNSYDVLRSSKGGDSSAFGVTANGGQSTYYASGKRYDVGDGGSGGGAKQKPGGSDGSDGTKYNAITPGGKGQGTTTREFGGISGKLYAGGGGGGGKEGLFPAGGAGGGGTGLYLNVPEEKDTSRANGAVNSGGGGGAVSYNGSSIDGIYGGSGGSGIVCIRNHR